VIDGRYDADNSMKDTPQIRSQAKLVTEALTVGSVFTVLGWLCSLIPFMVEEVGTFRPIPTFAFSSLIAYFVLRRLGKRS
jgi:hypothetical protein